MGFTGLYTEYYYCSWFIFVFLHREGAYDYYKGREEICGSHKQTDLIKICLTPSNAKKYVDSLRIKKDEKGIG